MEFVGTQEEEGEKVNGGNHVNILLLYEFSKTKFKVNEIVSGLSHIHCMT